MIVVVSGSRELGRVVTRATLERSPLMAQASFVYVGDCRGVDAHTYDWLLDRGLHGLKVTAHWKPGDKRGGRIRNERMVKMAAQHAKRDGLRVGMVALWDYGDGTAHAMECAVEAGFELELWGCRGVSARMILPEPPKWLRVAYERATGHRSPSPT